MGSSYFAGIRSQCLYLKTKTDLSFLLSRVLLERDFWCSDIAVYYAREGRKGMGMERGREVKGRR